MKITSTVVFVLLVSVQLKDVFHEDDADSELSSSDRDESEENDHISYDEDKGTFVQARKGSKEGLKLASFGEAFFKSGDYKSAVKSFLEALHYLPENHQVLSNLGTAYLALDQRPAAEETFLRALELEPTLINAHLSLGLLHMWDLDFEGAVDYFEQCLRLNVRQKECMYGLQASLALGDQNIRSTYARAEDFDPDPILDRVKAERFSGHLRFAIELYRAFADDSSSDPHYDALDDMLSDDVWSDKAIAGAAQPLKFAVTLYKPAEYKKHGDTLYKQAKAIYDALVELGYDTVLTSNVLLDEGRIHILLNAHLLGPYPTPLSPRTILFNQEQLYPGCLDFGWSMQDVFRHYPLWDYSNQNVDVLNKMGVRNVGLVPMGYMPFFSNIPKRSLDIDFLFIGAMAPRRRHVMEQLAEAEGGKYTTKIITGGVFDGRLDDAIARSKIVLNMNQHQSDESQIFNINRAMMLLANKKFMVSELGSDPDAETAFQGGVIFSPYDDLVTTCLHWIKQPAKSREAIALRGYEIVTAPEMAQTTLLEPALDALEDSVATRKAKLKRRKKRGPRNEL